jgi:hypothetical protein
VTEWARLVVLLGRVAEYRHQLDFDDEIERQREYEEGFDQWSVFAPKAEREDEKEPTSDPDEEAAA